MVAVAQGTRWVQKQGRGIVVIVPGGGTHANRPAYDDLARHFSVTYLDTRTRSGGFRYPVGWADITKVPLSRDPDDSLVGLARIIGPRMATTPPALILCGSRGGQVVLPLLLQHYWRGPFIAVNAGPLTSNAALPEGCAPLFVTCGRDYFPTSDPQFVRQRFHELSEVEGRNVFLPAAPHMPGLPARVLTSLVRHLLLGRALPPALKVYSLAPKAPRRPISRYDFTVQSRKASFVMLRKRATRDGIWYSDTRRFPNGAKVALLKQALDEDQYEMVYASDGAVQGWLYAINIAELQ